MPNEALFNIALMALETVLVGTLLASLFRLRDRFGLSPLYIAIGSFQYLQTLLALSIYVEVAPGIIISPGMVLFMAAPFAILLVYIREDAAETRSLILGLVVANTAISLLLPLFASHLGGPLTRNFLSLPPALFQMNMRVMLVGTGALILDAFLVIILFEALARLSRQRLLVSVIGSLALIALVDSLVFVTGAFWGSPGYREMLQSNILAKAGVGVLYSILLVLYLRYFDSRAEVRAPQRDLFNILSYRQKYEKLKSEMIRDPLTGLFDRRFFDEQLVLTLTMSTRTGQPVSLLMIDLDRLKEINDRYGHPEGDRVLIFVGAALEEKARGADIPCRIGGDEFAVILPGTSLEGAGHLSARLQQWLRDRSPRRENSLECRPAISIGAAEYPREAASPEELYSLADQRLYVDKAGGSQAGPRSAA